MRTFFGEGNQGHLRLGTRRSLLALSQSGWVASEVARLNPGFTVELVGIDTRGDKVLDVPLTQVQGKEFFVAELDTALRSGEVDFSVHSMKDLSLDRPEDFVLAAVPKRENQRDIAIFSERVFERLRVGLPIRIGTSSPRRQENLPSFFEQALPHLAGKPHIQLVDLRGNVNTRLGRLHESESSDRVLDGVVLAFAGMIRLWANETARLEMKSLLRGTRLMVLPLTHSPAAAAQGILAVECRKDDEKVRSVLRTLHSPEAERQAIQERAVLRKWGGGCHQRFGASAIHHPEFGGLLLVKGAATGGKLLDEQEWERAAPADSAATEVSAFDGTNWKAERTFLPSQSSSSVLSAGPCFVAHSAAVTESTRVPLLNSRIWTSGATSWFKLAAQGLWVEGCAEGFGFDWLRGLIQESILELPEWGSSWSVVTHEDATETWGTAKVHATYRIGWSGAALERAAQALRSATHVYWTSASQWEALKDYVAPNAVQSCGPGKTAGRLREKGLRPQVYPGHAHWRRALGLES